MRPAEVAALTSRLTVKQKQALLKRLQEKVASKTGAYAQFQIKYWSIPHEFAKNCIKWKDGEGLTPYQLAVMEEVPKGKRVALKGPHGLGKGQPHSVGIDTPAGKRRFGDLEVGDEVFGGDGRPVKVAGVFERGEMKVYRVSFSDGSSTLCSGDHLWTVRKFTWSKHKGEDPVEWETLTLDELMECGIDRPNGSGKRALKYHLPQIGELQYPPVDVPVDPYTLGVWLGDGTRKTSRITNPDDEVLARIRAAGHEVKVLRYKDVDCPTLAVKGLARKLAGIGAGWLGSRDRFVPKEYLENSPDNRREILRGLLDTDGTVHKDGTIAFSSTSEELARDVMWLARSLGGMARITVRENEFGPWYVVVLTLPPGQWFYIERKQDRLRDDTQERYLRRWISDVELVGTDQIRCIKVDAEDGLYITNDCIVTHNTTLQAILILWFALTRDGRDWKVPTLASVWRQLDKYLWPEVRKWATRLDWEKIGREPFKKTELKVLSLSLSTGEAFALASDDYEKIEGAHADHLLYIWDESKAIPDATWDASEGAFTGTGLTNHEAYGVATSTPGEPQGQFYRIHSRKPGYEDWKAISVTKEQCIAAGRMAASWAATRMRQWGEDSAVYKNRILGQFATTDEDCVIPLEWIEAANERWEEWVDAGRPGKFLGVGVDVADAPMVNPQRRGAPSKASEAARAYSTFARRYGDAIDNIEAKRGLDSIQVANHAATILQDGGFAVVDAIGVGSGSVGRLRELRLPVVGFVAGAGSTRRDATNTYGFADKRAEAWWGLRELLDPGRDATLALPPDDDLIGDLTAPKWQEISGSRIRVESKNEIVKRLRRSTDRGDAVVMICNETSAEVGGTFTHQSVMEAVTADVKPLFADQVEKLDHEGVIADDVDQLFP